jgi:predicted TIM-barrel enzyme
VSLEGVRVTTPPEEAWRWVGVAIDTRIRDRNWSKAEVIRRTKEVDPTGEGVSRDTLNAWINGQPIVRPDKARILCDALGWHPSSIERIFAGLGPLEDVPTDRVATLERAVAQLTQAVESIADLLRRHFGDRPPNGRADP